MEQAVTVVLMLHYMLHKLIQFSSLVQLIQLKKIVPAKIQPVDIFAIVQETILRLHLTSQ